MDNPIDYKLAEHRIRTIRPGDKMYKIRSGFMMAGRASIQISPDCPTQYASIITECYRNGWLSAVAHVTEKEYTLMGLSNGND